eukprot:scaffold743_cov267-Pinguiococcus_pyrenoidosus.AAC.19
MGDGQPFLLLYGAPSREDRPDAVNHLVKSDLHGLSNPGAFGSFSQRFGRDVGFIVTAMICIYKRSRASS